METRNGFQDRDIGYNSIGRGDFGPDYGPDYARFSDQPDEVADQNLRDKILHELKFSDLSDVDVKVRNGFVLVDYDELEKESFENLVRKFPEVRDIIYSPRS